MCHTSSDSTAINRLSLGEGTLTFGVKVCMYEHVREYIDTLKTRNGVHHGGTSPKTT